MEDTQPRKMSMLARGCGGIGQDNGTASTFSVNDARPLLESRRELDTWQERLGHEKRSHRASGGTFTVGGCGENLYIEVFYITSTPTRLFLRVHCNTWGITSRNVSETCVQLSTPFYRIVIGLFRTVTNIAEEGVYNSSGRRRHIGTVQGRQMIRSIRSGECIYEIERRHRSMGHSGEAREAELIEIGLG